MSDRQHPDHPQRSLFIGWGLRPDADVHYSSATKEADEAELEVCAAYRQRRHRPPVGEWR